MNKFKIYILLFLLFINIGSSYAQISFYVAPDGSDSNKGNINAPFKTLQKARDEIRTLRSKGLLTAAVNVFFRQGIYRFSEPLVLSAEDSGSKQYPITYSAYNNEKVVFSGSKALQLKWEPYNDRLWVASVKLKNDRSFTPRSLWMNNQTLSLARYPNFIPEYRPFGGVASDCLSTKRVSTWKSPEGAYVHGMQQGKWGSMHYKIIDVKNNIPHLLLVSTNTTTMYNNAQLHHNDRFVENIFEELDAPGEWFYNKMTHKIYFYPPADLKDFQNKTLEAPVTASIIQLKGDLKHPVKYISFKGIQFEKTRSTWYLTLEHLPVGDYVIDRDAVVLMEGTEHCKVINCTFTQIGGNGVLLSNYNLSSSVEGCSFKNLQANGVVLVGNRDAMRDSPWCEVTHEMETKDLSKNWGYVLTYNVWKEPWRDTCPSKDETPGPKTENYPRYCKIENNLITRIGELEKQAAGILLSMCAENTINHNTIYDVPRAGICINDGCWGGQIVENNDVFHTVLSTADHGPFNSWGRDRHWTMKMHGIQKRGHERAKERARLDSYLTTIIRHNRFEHTVSNHSWGIDLDDGSSNYHIYNNLTIGCSFKLREGFYRTVENNICIGKYPPGKHVCFDRSEDIIRHNIYVNTEDVYMFDGIHCKPSEIMELDSNLYYSLVAKSVKIKLSGKVQEGFLPSMTLEQWKKKGLDKHSKTGDPLFENIKEGNYKLKKNSPAFSIGFKEFPLNNFGTTIPALKEEAVIAHQKFKESLLPTNKKQEKEIKNIRTWLGAQITNMTTDAEKSAAGIDEIKGVILLDMPTKSYLYKAGGRSGDVILKANGYPIKNIKTLMKIIDHNKKKSLKVWVDGNPPAHEFEIVLP